MSPKRPGFLVSLSLMLAAPGLALGQTSAPTSSAVSDRAKARDVIPAQPSQPPQLSREIPPLLFSCQRHFLWQRKELACDSPQFRDAENLRPIMNAVPRAELQLDAYQLTRTKVRQLGYIGAGGLALLLGSLFLPNSTSKSIQLGMMVTGIMIADASFFYGLGALHGNENKLHHAIDLYNQAQPQTPIEFLNEDLSPPKTANWITLGGAAAVAGGLLISNTKSSRRMRGLLISMGGLVVVSSSFYSLGVVFNDDILAAKTLAPKLTMEFHF